MGFSFSCPGGNRPPTPQVPGSASTGGVSGAILGNFYSAGQICSNGTRVFVERSVRAAFVAKLLDRVARIRLGDPMD